MAQSYIKKGALEYQGVSISFFGVNSISFFGVSEHSKNEFNEQLKLISDVINHDIKKGKEKKINHIQISVSMGFGLFLSRKIVLSDILEATSNKEEIVFHNIEFPTSDGTKNFTVKVIHDKRVYYCASIDSEGNVI